MVYSIDIKYKDEIFKCFLDLEDFEYFKNFNWSYRCGYVSRQRTKKDPKGGRWIHIHREVLIRSGKEIPKGFCVDHINRTKMDNRKENLRIVTYSENIKNVSNEGLNNRRKNAQRATDAAAKLPRTKKQLKLASIQAKRINELGLNIRKGKDNVRSKEVIDTKTGIIYESARQASLTLGINYSTLRGWLNGSNPNNSTLIYNNHKEI